MGSSPLLEINEYTVSAWVNIASKPAAYYHILSTRAGHDTTFDYKVMSTYVHGDFGSGSGCSAYNS